MTKKSPAESLEIRMHKTIRIRPSVFNQLKAKVAKSKKRHIGQAIETAITQYCRLDENSS